MNTIYSIKNFKTFDEKGVNVKFSPITVLTGCNSSGKSSITKSLVLLNSFFEEIGHSAKFDEENLWKAKLNFYDVKNDLLGNFDIMLNENAENGTITFSYTTYSLLLSANILVELRFCADSNDVLNNGFMKEYSIVNTDNNEVIVSADKEHKTVAWEKLRKPFEEFAVIYLLLSKIKGYTYEHYEMAIVNKEDFEQSQRNDSEIRDAIEKYCEKAKVSKQRLDDISAFRSKCSIYKSFYLPQEVVEKNHEYDLYTYTPILETLKNCTKTTIDNCIRGILDKKDSDCKIDERAIAKVIDDFKASKQATFIDYYKENESAYFSANNFSDSINFYSSIYPRRGTPIPLSVESLNKQKSSEEWHQEKIKKWEERPVNFADIIYSVLQLNKAISVKYEDFCNDKVMLMNGDLFENGKVTSAVLQQMHAFVNMIVNEMFTSDFVTDTLTYVPSSRVKVERLYKIGETNEFSVLLNNYLNEIMNATDAADVFLDKWIKEFHVGESLSIERDSQGIGVCLKLKKKNGKVHLLADEGYGVTQLVSMLLQISLNIFNKQKRQHQTVIIEEPEIHLHPSFQSKLAQMFVEVCKENDIHFIVETHSEYLIRKLQTMVAMNNVSADEISLNYVYGMDDYVSPSDSRVKNIEIRKDGSLSDSFGSGFFDEADNLSMDLMRIQIM